MTASSSPSTEPTTRGAKPTARLVIPVELTGEARGRHRVRWVAASTAIVVVGAMLLWMAPWRQASGSYRAEPAQRRTIVRRVEALGHLDLARKFLVSAPAPGRLEEVTVVVGQHVSRNQVLARLDRTTAVLATQSARGNLLASRQKVAEAHAAWTASTDARTRAERLASRGLASQSDLVAAQGIEARTRALWRGAQAESEVASRALAGAQLQDQLTTLLAPSDGVVLSAPDAVGGAVGPTSGPLFVLGDTLDSLRLRVPVSEADVAEVRAGQIAQFSVPAFPDTELTARVERIDVQPTGERGAVMYPVTLTAENPGRALLPGMTATVRIEVQRVENALAVREAALRFVPAGAGAGPARSRVWRLDGKRRLHEVAVVPGLSDGAYTEVRPVGAEGLDVGQPVVIGLSVVTDPGVVGPGVTLGKRQ